MSEKKKSPTSRINSDSAVKAALSVCIKHSEDYEQKLAEFEPLTNVEGLKAALHEVIATSTDVDEISAARRELATLSDADAVTAARGRARVIAMQAQAELKASIPALLDAGERVLATLKAEAAKAEEEFFASFAVPRKATFVTSRLTAIEESIKGFRESLNPQPHQQAQPLPGMYANVLDYFA